MTNRPLPLREEQEAAPMLTDERIEQLGNVTGVIYPGRVSLSQVRRFARLIESEVATTPKQEAVTAAVVASGEPSTEYGWLVENGKQQGQGLAYRYIDNDGGGMSAWTEDPNKALRFARREDAEQYAHHDEDAWRIVEHAWHTASTIPRVADHLEDGGKA